MAFVIAAAGIWIHATGRHRSGSSAHVPEQAAEALQAAAQ
jgi:hypothetical protein